jgi:glutamine amidotransferase
MKTVAVVDYGMCNLDSVRRAVEECGGTPVVTDRAEDIETATHIILPGVGSFRDGMRNLSQRSLDQILREQVVGRQIPFLGICLGMQMLATKGWEGGETDGLGWIDGEVQRLEPSGEDTRIPHIGWDEVLVAKDSPMFDGIGSAKDFYFVHSYHLRCRNEQDVLARTLYCGGFVSAVGRGQVFGVQFHPEKSQRVGFQVLKNFLSV